MKHLYFYIVFMTTIALSFGQNKQNILSKFNTNGMQTNILVQKSPLVNINAYNHKPINVYAFYQAYKTIAQNDIANRFQPLSHLKNKSKQARIQNTVPIHILHSMYETIKPSAFKNGLVGHDSSGYLLRHTNSSEIFDLHQLTLGTTLAKKHKGLAVNFFLDTVINTTNNAIATIHINFDDGNGYQLTTNNQNISVLYPTEGKKQIKYRLTLNNGQIINRSSELEISYSNVDMQTLFNQTILPISSYTTPDLTAYNEPISYPGIGEYQLFLSPDNILDKPIFLMDGFDPEDTRDIAGIYSLLNYNDGTQTLNLADLVRAQGFDVVILNFPEYIRPSDNAIIDGGSDFIERNAMVLVNLINTINAQKTGTAQNVVIGPSMGGLISRYALNYMEQQNLNHDTRLYISFDSPHLGANVPIGFQHQLNFLAYGLNDFTFIGNQNVEELQPIIDGMLKSPAARQMLTDQLEAHLITNNAEETSFDPQLTLPEAHPFKSIFYSNLNSLTTTGFPENTRNVTVINGSGVNNRYPNNLNPPSAILPGAEVLNTTFDVATGTDAILRLNFTPLANQTIETSYVEIDFAWYIPAFDVSSSADSKAHAYSDGVDAASGGLFDLATITADLDTSGLVGDFLSALQTDYFNFIPSVSAMAYNNTPINWYYAPTNVTTAVTPFDNWHMPTDNEPHVTLTPANVAFVLQEILPQTLQTSTTEIPLIKLKQNPVSNQLTILSNALKNVSVTITDNSGKTVYKINKNFNVNATEIPLNLASGFYILNIKNSTVNYTTKFLKH